MNKSRKAYVYFGSHFSGVLNRAAALTVLAALLVPLFLFEPFLTTSARTLPIPQMPAVVSAPPEAFLVAQGNLVGGQFAATLGGFLSTSVDKVKSFFGKPQIPAGLEQPENQLALSETLSSESSSVSSPLFLAPGAVRFDFDGDGKADPARWKSSSTELKIKNSSSGNFTTAIIGSSSSVIAPGDFDGDGKTDAAVFTAGVWTIKKSSNGQTITVNFGTIGDKPVVGDYDGDGKSDCTVFRPSTNTWWILKSSNGTNTATAFGASGDVPAQGNYDGDAYTDIAVYRPSTGDWHVLGSTAGYYTFHWGISTDVPVPADYDGDGKTDFAIYRGSTGTWYVSKSSSNNAQYFTQVWGNYGDQPAPADYNGDAKDDFAVWRPTTGVWHIVKSGSNPAAYDYQTLGQAGDTAVSAAYLKQIGGAVAGYDLAQARLSPKNETGGTDLYSQNFGWSTSLVGLPGRAGMDMGFGISYNSLVWTKDPTANALYFDADNSNVSPGFRFGFPTIEPIYWDQNAQRFNYLMVTPSGGKVEFRQLQGASDTYETADSSYSQLKTTGAANPNAPVEGITITVSSTNGTKMTYVWKAGAFRCSEIKDRNGNFITVNHNDQGLLTSVTDTLGRIVTVDYDDELSPVSIKQTRKNSNGSGSDFTYTWASFTYTGTTIDTNFNSSLANYGPANGTVLKVLQKITFPNGAFTTFDYNVYGQVKRITNFAADANALNYVETDLADAAGVKSDCPRFSETRNWAKNFNQNQAVVVTNTVTPNSSYSLPGNIAGTATKIEVKMPNHPHGLVSNTFVGASGWKEGLPLATEDWANGSSGLERKRWTWTSWTQDNENVAEIRNPRLVENKVGDEVNIKRTLTEYRQLPYSTIAEYGLVSAVNVYDSDQTTILKRLETEYNLSSAYTSRRILGLPAEVRAYGKEGSALNLVSKVSYTYDGEQFNAAGFDQNISPIQHDGAYDASFVAGRGNLTKTTRWNVQYSTIATEAVSSSVKYNTAGGAVAQIDAVGRTVKIDYADNFNSSPANRNTYAYPTKLTELANTDSSNNFSIVKYRFDTGANVWAKSPSAAGNAVGTGKESTREYDAVGRLLKVKVVNLGGAYTRYEYPSNGLQSKMFSTVVDQNNDGADSSDEVLSESWTDGAGRVRYSRTEHPGSANGWRGSIAEYDILGQLKRSTVPTEISVSNPSDPSSWTPVGDDVRYDANGNLTFLWRYQKYDWKGRVVRKIDTDGVDSPTPNASDQFISYDGCGCAGGQVTTIQGALVPRDDIPNQSARRTQKIYEDVLGRVYKTETLKWNGAVYSTTLTTFNGRDQAVSVLQQDNSQNPVVEQSSTATFDGHGRLKTSHRPEQQNANGTPASTVYNYNADDTISQMTDARGASANYIYNERGLLEQINYAVSQNPNIPVTPTVTFGYDAVGNRTTMTDGYGNVNYEYNQLSQMTAETRQFTDSLPNAPTTGNKFRLEYSWALSGQLKSLKDPYGQQINYAFDKVGRLSSVYGTTAFDGITNYASTPVYNARGIMIHLDYGNGVQMNITNFNNKLQAASFEVKKGSTDIQKKNYEFYDDGALKYSQDVLDNKFDRLYKYDFQGRTTEAKTGFEARNETGTEAVPYRQNYAYSAFGQLTSRNGQFWGNNANLSYNYQNNRMTGNGLQFDEDGRILNGIDDTSATYDAAGQIQRLISWLVSDIYRYSDGNGKEIKRQTTRYIIEQNGDEHWSETPEKEYYIRSTVLGNEVVTEVDKTGRKQRTFVRAGGSVLAEQGAWQNGSGQNFEYLFFKHGDASGGSLVSTKADGTTVNYIGSEESPAELDGLGQNVGKTQPIEPPNPPSGFPAWGELMPEDPLRVNGQKIGVNVDGISLPMGFNFEKSYAMKRLTNGSLDFDWSKTDKFLFAQLGVYPRFISGSTDAPAPPGSPEDSSHAYATRDKIEYYFDWNFRQAANPIPDPPPPSSGCDNFFVQNYSRIEGFFNDIWQRHLNSRTPEHKGGLEQGAVVFIHPDRLDPSTRREEVDVSHYRGKTENASLGNGEFTNWAIEQKRIKALEGWIGITVHTHSELLEDGTKNPYDDIVGISLGDYKNAPSNNLDAVITETQILLYNGSGNYNKREHIKCIIDRKTGAYRSNKK